MSALGHSLPSHSTSGPTDVRYCPKATKMIDEAIVR